MSDERNPEDYTFDKGYASIHEILAANGVNQRALIEQLDKEEALERAETEDEIKADIEHNKEKTKYAKAKFISEIKSGLGEEMKKDPTSVKMYNEDLSFWTRLSRGIKKIFTRF